jgi:hypothetical protein
MSPKVKRPVAGAVAVLTAAAVAVVLKVFLLPTGKDRGQAGRPGPSTPVASAENFRSSVPSFPSAARDDLPSVRKVASLQEGGKPPREPAGSAVHLIHAGSPAAWAAFVQSSAGMSSKEQFLEVLGQSARPEASAFLKEVLNYPEEALRRAAIRGLALTGSALDVQFLGQLIFNPDFAIEETTEAALALGKAPVPAASGILIQAYSKTTHEELVQCILIGLAERPFQQTQTFFQMLLANPSESSARKKDALEALGQMDAVRDPFFLQYLESADAEVRRGAYLGIGKLSESALGNRLLLCLQKETDSAARDDLYEALSLKNSGNASLLTQIASAEADPNTRLLAAKALSRNLQDTHPQDPCFLSFEKTWVPELLQVVLTGGQSERSQALMALLMFPRCESSRAALEKIVRESQVSAIRDHAARALAPAR